MKFFIMVDKKITQMLEHIFICIVVFYLLFLLHELGEM
jgi:hypothetical protein